MEAATAAVKSTLRPQYVTEFEQVLQEFKALNTEHSDKKMYCIMAFVGKLYISNNPKPLAAFLQNKQNGKYNKQHRSNSGRANY